jgi:hypothetical protein
MRSRYASMAAWLGALALILAASVSAIAAAEHTAPRRPIEASYSAKLAGPVDPCTARSCR